MTLDLNSVPAIAGESARRIRDILCRSYGAFREDWLSDKFRYNERRTREIVKALQAAGYVVRDRERERERGSSLPWYVVTDAGRDLVRSSAARRIKRETATRVLSGFMKRVHLVNENSKYLYSVRCVVVFGSFLECGDCLGDVDVAVDLRSRIEFDKKHKWVEVFQQHARKSGRSRSSFIEQIFWPRREVLLMLKSRKRSISIQPWHSFVEMEKAKNFKYQVLLGDAKEIRCELAKARRERRFYGTANLEHFAR
jgi:predicted nucleotidyltransferase